MTTGLLGSADLAATTLTTICTLSGSQAFTVNVCNRNATNVNIRIAPLAAVSASPTNAEYFVYDSGLQANNVMQLSGLTSSGTKYVVVYSDTANVSVNVYGV